jgi:hypothetical protein
MFTDEVVFTQDGITSTRNLYSLAQEDPNHVSQCKFSTTWHGVLGNYQNGPHVIKGLLTATYYRNFLENELPLYLKVMPLVT